MKTWIISMTAAALLALAAPFYAIWADTPPGNPSDPADQPTAPPSELPARDSADTPGNPTEAMPEASSGPAPAAEPGVSRDAGATALPTQAAAQDARLAAVLPPGVSRADACNGFKSDAECLAALHAAHNLNIPFADLKSRATRGQRLTAVVTELKPGSDAKAEVRKAEEQAQLDVGPPRG